MQENLTAWIPFNRRPWEYPIQPEGSDAVPIQPASLGRANHDVSRNLPKDSQVMATIGWHEF